jgi:hypothetical protein
MLHRGGVGDDLEQGRSPMKKLVTALAIAVLAVAPAFAKKYRQTQTSMPPDNTSLVQGSDAYAYVPGDQGPMVGRGDPNAVYAYGQYQGSDPDPFIRSQLYRDPPTNTW